MKNPFPIIVLLLSVACGASVAGTHEVALADIGYGSDIVLSGQRPFQVFFFPIPAGEIRPAKSYVELSVRLSQALHRNSIIRIEVNNIPVLTLTLGQMQLTEKTLKIPLTQADLVKVAHPVDRAEYLKVTVSGHLTISGGPCPEIETVGLWMVIDRKSKVSFSFQPEPQRRTIANFLATTSGPITVVVPQFPSVETAQNALWVLSDLKKRGLKISVEEALGERPARIVQEDEMVAGTVKIEEEIMQGFRVQIFASSSIDEANAMKLAAATRLADIGLANDSLYVVYDPPMYKVRVGDYPTRLEANRAHASIIQRGFPDAWVLADRIIHRKVVRVRKDVVIIALRQEISLLPWPYDMYAAREQFPDDATDKDGLFFLATVGDHRMLYLSGLTETGLAKAAQAFIDDRIRSSLISSSAVVRDVRIDSERRFSDPPYRVTLRELGYDNVIVSGLGILRVAFLFHRQALGRAPNDVLFHLFGSSSQVSSHDRGFLNVYFNDLLLQSWELREGGRFDRKLIDLPNYALRDDNKLEVEFAYFPERECDRVTFSGNVFNISYFETRESKEKEFVTFDILTEAFTEQTLMLISPPITPRILETAATLVSLIDRNVRTKYLYPRLQLTTAFDYSAFENSSAILIAPPHDTLYAILHKSLPLDPRDVFRVVNAQDGSIMFEAASGAPLAVLQVFRTSNSGTILAATPVGGGAEALLGDFVDAVAQNPRLMEGNIGLYGEQANLYFFNTERRLAEVEYPERETFFTFLERNKFVIFAVLWVIFSGVVVALSLYARRRGYKSVEIKNP